MLNSSKIDLIDLIESIETKQKQTHCVCGNSD